MNNIKILDSLTERKQNNLLVIGTHNGIFHVDEVVACAILCLLNRLLNSNIQIWILRTRDSEMLAQCDICVDVGCGEFDHHIRGFNKTRKNGIKYASAGLVWKHFGKQLITLVLKKYFPNYDCNIDFIFKTFDEQFIVFVDCEDNGKDYKKNGLSTKNHCFKYISSFLPTWDNNSAEDFNNQFYKVLILTIDMLEEQIKAVIGKEITKKIIEANWNNIDSFNNGILEIPSQTMDWIESVTNINASHIKKKINFVIFPYHDGGWAAQCVPPSLKKKFGQRIPFPKEWSGQTDKLAEISGIRGATSCHNDCFFVRATSKGAVIKMCEIALDSVKSIISTIIAFLKSKFKR